MRIILLLGVVFTLLALTCTPVYSNEVNTQVQAQATETIESQSSPSPVQPTSFVETEVAVDAKHDSESDSEADSEEESEGFGEMESEEESEGEQEAEDEMESEHEGESESEFEAEEGMEHESEVEGEAEHEVETDEGMDAYEHQFNHDGMAFTQMTEQDQQMPAMPAIPASMLEQSTMSPPPQKTLPLTPPPTPRPMTSAPQIVTPGVKEDKWTQALTAVNAEIMQRAQEINSEKAWTKQVVNLIKEYGKKHKKVLINMNAIRGQVKELLKKKKQVQNAMIQRELNTKIKQTKRHLKKIGGHIGHLKKKQTEFEEKKNQLLEMTQEIKKQLRKLRGEKEKKPGVKKF